jgi:streptogramin lyase
MFSATSPSIRFRTVTLFLAGALVGAAAAVAQPAGSPKPDPTLPTPAAVPSSTNPARGTLVPEVSRACWVVFQAKSGDYWFGSDGQGLFRWGGDGKPIINYTPVDGVGKTIRGIQEDTLGNIYFTTLDAGICRFDGRAFTTLPVAPTPADGGWRLHPDDLWFKWFKGMPSAPSTPGKTGIEGPYRYDGTNLYHLQLPESDRAPKHDPNAATRPWSSNDIYSIYRDSRGHVWFGTGGYGACRYDGAAFGWLYETHLTATEGGGSFGIRSVIEDKDGAFWICNTRYRFRVQAESKDAKVVYTREAGVDEKLTEGLLYFQGAVRDEKGDLWLSPYGGGIWRYHAADGSMKNYPVKDHGEDTQVFSIYKDAHGGLWLGTPTAGPYRFNGEAFEQFKP